MAASDLERRKPIARLAVCLCALACASCSALGETGGDPVDAGHAIVDGGIVGDAGANDGATQIDGSRGHDASSDGEVRDGEVDARAPFANRAASIPIGIENVNDSPMLSASYRALLRFVPDATITIDRFYFGFKLRGASCWDSGLAGYGGGDGGTLNASLVTIDPATGLPGSALSTEAINGCARHEEAKAAVGADPVLVWVNVTATLEAGRMYALIVRNTHVDPAKNFFSFNMPLADTAFAGPHARNELSPNATGAILSLDPREHVAWSVDDGTSWRYGSANGQYASYMNDHDSAHPATRMPQYGFRTSSGVMSAPQPYYAYSDDCASCSVTNANARFGRTFAELGGFTAGASGVGTLTLTNTSTGEHASCTPAQGYGFGKCTLPSPIHVAVGETYEVASTGSVEIMRLDNPQRILFPRVGVPDGDLRAFQSSAAPGTDAKDVPSLWAGPLSANFRAPNDP